MVPEWTGNSYVCTSSLYHELYDIRQCCHFGYWKLVWNPHYFFNSCKNVCVCVWWQLMWAAFLLLYVSKYVPMLFVITGVYVCAYMNFIIKCHMTWSCDNCVNYSDLWVADPWTVLSADECTATLVDKQHSALHSLVS
jgi:hypothetical protein